MRPVAAQRRPGLVRSLVATVASNAGILAINVCTGVLVARLLGPDRRGEVAVLLTFAQILGWLGALGINEGLTYVAATRPERLPRLTSTALALGVVLATVGLAFAELLLPLLLADQPHLVHTGRVFALSIYLSVLGSFLLGVLTGDHDFVTVNALRVLQPATYLALLVALATTTGLTTEGVLASSAAASGVVVVLAALRTRARYGFGRPSLSSAREAASFGLRGWGSAIGGLGTARLDVLLMPSYVSTAVIGLYSISTSVANMVVQLVAAVSVVLFPAAARLGRDQGAVLMTRVLRLALFGSAAAVVPLALVAPQLLALVYGKEFTDAALALRLLLPGMVFALGTSVAESWLQSVGRPLAASVGQFAGLAVTVVGLLATLPSLGAAGAASTTSVAYAATFLWDGWRLKRAGLLQPRSLVQVTALVDDLRVVRARLPVHRLRRRSAGRGAAVAVEDAAHAGDEPGD